MPGKYIALWEQIRKVRSALDSSGELAILASEKYFVISATFTVMV